MQKLQDIQQMYENRNQVATTLGVFQHDPYLSTALSSTGDSEANSPFRMKRKSGCFIGRSHFYCLATSRSIVNLTSSPTTALGNFVAIPKAVRLIVVVAEKPE